MIRRTIATSLPVVMAIIGLAACGQTLPEPSAPVATQPSASLAAPDASQAAFRVGGLAAGDHEAQGLDPGLRFRVPAGWSSSDPGDYFRFDLVGPSDQEAGVISFASGPFQAGTSPDCAVGAGLPSAAGVVERLSADPRLSSGHVQPVTLGGLSGLVVDLELDPNWSTACPASTCASMRAAPACESGAPGAALIVRPDGPHFPMLGIFGTERVRLILLDPGDVTCCSVAIAIHAPDADLFEEFVTESAPVIESLQFGR